MSSSQMVDSNDTNKSEKNIAEALKSNYNVMKRRFLEMVEELKMRRKNDQEMELKINTLLTEKFELKRLKEEEIMLLQKENDELKQQNLHIQKEFEEKNKLHEQDKTSQSMAINSSGQGIKALKDEILSLQLTKYSLEKKIKDQEHQLQSGARERDDINKRILDYQTLSGQVQQRMEELDTRLTYLSDLVIKTEAMHQNLVDTSSHHKCLVLRYEETIKGLQRELTVCKAELTSLQMSKKEKKPFKNVSESPTIHNGSLIQEQLQNELKGVREQNKFLMTSLTESNRMLSCMKTKNDTLNQHNNSYQLEIEELRTETEVLKEDLRNLNAEKDEQLKKFYQNEEAMNGSELKFNTEIQKVEANNTILLLRVASLEESNEKLQDQIKSLERQLVAYQSESISSYVTQDLNQFLKTCTQNATASTTLNPSVQELPTKPVNGHASINRPDIVKIKDTRGSAFNRDVESPVVPQNIITRHGVHKEAVSDFNTKSIDLTATAYTVEPMENNKLTEDKTTVTDEPMLPVETRYQQSFLKINSAENKNLSLKAKPESLENGVPAKNTLEVNTESLHHQSRNVIECNKDTVMEPGLNSATEFQDNVTGTTIDVHQIQNKALDCETGSRDSNIAEAEKDAKSSDVSIQSKKDEIDILLTQDDIPKSEKSEE